MDPIQIGEQQYTVEQLQDALTKADAYKKLEPEFTRKSQALSDAEKQLEELKPWGEFDAFVRQNPTLAKQINDVYEAYTKGATVTQANLNAISKGIDKADKQGDDETVKRLEALEAQLAERQINDTLAGFEQRAKSDGLEDFTLDGFKEFADKWLEEEEGVGEDDNVTPSHLKRAYTAYEAHLLKETIKRGKVPSLGSNSVGAPKPNGDQKDKPRGLRARHEALMAGLGRK